MPSRTEAALRSCVRRPFLHDTHMRHPRISNPRHVGGIQDLGEDRGGVVGAAALQGRGAASHGAADLRSAKGGRRGGQAMQPVKKMDPLSNAFVYYIAI